MSEAAVPVPAQDHASPPKGPRLPPGPRGWPLLGHIPDVRRLGVLTLLERSWKEFGDVFTLDLGVRAVVVAHPDGIKRVLAGNAKNYVKGRSYSGVRKVIGEGVLALEGEAWKKRRALVQPAFHRANLAKLTEAMVESGQRHFDAHLERHGTLSFELDAHRDMVELTLDVVVAALFGKNLVDAADVSYETLGAALELVSERTNGITLPLWVPTPSNRKFVRTISELEGAVYRVIEAGRRRAESDGSLLGMLIESRDADTGAPLTDQELRDEVFTLFVAGHETTALTLTWLFTLLDGRRDVLDRMVAEVDAVLGERLDPGFEDVQKLRYVRQVIDETLRLRGPVATLARDVVADDEVLGMRVRKGDMVMPFFYGVHRHPEFWSEPERFDPDRFGPEASKARNPWSYLPFSAGQRQCVGNTFSLVESVVLIAQLLRRFEVEVASGQSEVRQVMLATVRPDRPVKVSLRARRR